jgi:hypothetical protein
MLWQGTKGKIAALGGNHPLKRKKAVNRGYSRGFSKWLIPRKPRKS